MAIKMTNAEIFKKLGIAFSEAEGMKYTAAQMLRLYLRSLQKGRAFALPCAQDENELSAFANFLNDNLEAFTAVKPGLGCDWFSGDSLFSNDEKRLYFFVFTKCGEPQLVKGVMNKKKELFHLKSGKPVEIDKNLGLGEGPGSIWLMPSEKDEATGCSVICLKCSEPIKLYKGTGAPITQN